ncbi:MAG TPA: PilZ domain-containing protein [Candidatus Acidoferrum sp.]|nr:PilZ domain-containing protein [Candidatus Acidoferrum sp.]
MPDGADRREARRFNMTLPMKVLSLDSNAHELKAYTRDVSYRGLYFLAESEFRLGSSIDFIITLPEQVTRSADVNIRCHGQIVRTESTQNGKMGVAAKIDRYEFMHTAA